MNLTGSAIPLGAASFCPLFGERVGKHHAIPAVPFKSFLFLLPFFLTACVHKTAPPPVQPIAPPISTVPRPNPEPVVLPAAANTIPAPALPQLKPSKEPQKSAKHSKPASATTPQASNAPLSVSAIGQLSSGSPYDLRSQASDSILAIERRLSGLGRVFSEQELKTAAQIREFLKQARAALASGDVDGANTLAAKAKVLLGELTR